MLLNILKSAVNAKPVANMDFILTNDKSRLLFLSFSSSLSIFFLCCLSSESPCVSLRFSTRNIIIYIIIPIENLKKYVYISTEYTQYRYTYT